MFKSNINELCTKNQKLTKLETFQRLLRARAIGPPDRSPWDTCRFINVKMVQLPFSAGFGFQILTQIFWLAQKKIISEKKT